MEMKPLSGRRRAYDRILRFLLYFCAALTCALLLFIIGYIFFKGLPHVTWQFLSTQPSFIKDTIGILPNILNTVYLVGVTLIITLPLGVGAAIYLTEYARNRRLVAAIEFATETLTGIPSIIFGLVGMLFFIQMMGLKTGVLAGGLTLVVMILPTIVRTTQESLKTVPDSYREGALAMGAGKWHMVRTVVLPNATVKIFLTATPEARAERRYKELLMKGEKHDYQNVLADVRARDYQDTHRAAARRPVGFRVGGLRLAGRRRQLLLARVLRAGRPRRICSGRDRPLRGAGCGGGRPVGGYRFPLHRVGVVRENWSRAVLLYSATQNNLQEIL